jgi:hypothetical protein
MLYDLTQKNNSTVSWYEFKTAEGVRTAKDPSRWMAIFIQVQWLLWMWIVGPVRMYVEGTESGYDGPTPEDDEPEE